MLGLLLSSAGEAQVPVAHKTENVIVVMMDGMRWEEVFHGADADLIKTLGPEALGAPKERAAYAQQQYWRETPAERRQVLMPFLWSAFATHGQIFGNRDLGSDSAGHQRPQLLLSRLQRNTHRLCRPARPLQRQHSQSQRHRL